MEAGVDANEAMHGLWLQLRDDASPTEMMHVLGAIVMAQLVGLFDDERAELWRRRVLTCPGHDDEGCRSWCAYCGNMKPHEPEPDDSDNCIACGRHIDVCDCDGGECG